MSTKTKFKVFITPEGEVCGVYHDFFRVLDLGPLEIQRASNVEFNPALQKWEASWPEGGVFCMADKRDDCLQLEREQVEVKLRKVLSSATHVG